MHFRQLLERNMHTAVFTQEDNRQPGPLDHRDGQSDDIEN